MPYSQAKTKALTGLLYSGLSQFVKLILSFGSQIVLARILSVDDFGLIALYAPVVLFAQIIANAGISTLIIQKQNVTVSELTSLLTLGLVSSVAMAVLVVASSPVLAYLYGDPRLFIVGMLAALTVLFSGLQSQRLAILSRSMEFGALAIIDFASSIFGAIVSIAMAYNTRSYVAIAIYPLLAAITSFVLTLYLGTHPIKICSLASLSKRDLKSSLNILGLDIFGTLNVTVDNILIGSELGQYELGIYDRAWKSVVSPFSQLIAPFGRVAIPLLSRLLSQPEDYRKTASLLISVMTAVTAPLILVLIVNSDYLFLTIFGRKWADSAPVFSWICFGSFLTPINAAIFWMFISQERNKEQFLYGSLVILINTLSYVVGVFWGVIGVAAFSAISVYTLQTPILIYGLSKNRLMPIRLILTALLYPFVAIVVSGMSVLALHSNDGHVGALAVCIDMLVSFLFQILFAFVSRNLREFIFKLVSMSLRAFKLRVL